MCKATRFLRGSPTSTVVHECRVSLLTGYDLCTPTDWLVVVKTDRS